ncbi:hypothetical protein ACH5RR_015255 [Cinchona calisaya]|uniref:Uncharacterized protein n=1 Tax=Cinchona calisaya TaxID=153742 RepID=A0ABD2ZSL3_9GENT
MKMASLKFFVCLVLLLLSSGISDGRPLKPISIAREALQAQFERVKMNEINYEWPERVAPAGPDPHHHFDNHNE